MRSVVRVILGFTILGSLVALGLSIWPGVLNDLLVFAILLSVLWVPLGAIVCVVAAVVLTRMHRQSRLSRASVAELMAIPGVAFLTLALLVFYVPRRVAFLGSRSAFERSVKAAPRSEYGVPLGERLGLYRVDQCAADPRGGAYFRVYSGADGIGPDTMSYGFVEQPNPQGTPFGAARYATFHLVDNWYWFRASNDWY